MKLWKGHYEMYRGEMQQVMERDDEFKNESADEIILKYKQILYGGKEFEESTRKNEDIYNEAQAIYQITYDYAKEKGVTKCGFAWKVAGRALCIMYATNQDDNMGARIVILFFGVIWVDIPWELKAETFPHFLEKRNFPSYTSKSVLGLIYDTVDLKTEDKSKEIWQLPCFSGEVPAACMKLWKEHYEVYRGEMQQVMERDDEFKNESADEIILKYKQILYGGKEFEESTRKIEDIYNEAQAIYLINL